MELCNRFTVYERLAPRSLFPPPYPPSPFTLPPLHTPSHLPLLPPPPHLLLFWIIAVASATSFPGISEIYIESDVSEDGQEGQGTGDEEKVEEVEDMEEEQEKRIELW